MRCLGLVRGLAGALRAFTPRVLDLIVLRVDVSALLCLPVHFLVTAGRAACLVVGFCLAIVASLIVRTAQDSTSRECRVGKGTWQTSAGTRPLLTVNGLKRRLYPSIAGRPVSLMHSVQPE